jgi:hypothetical protein
MTPVVELLLPPPAGVFFEPNRDRARRRRQRRGMTRLRQSSDELVGRIYRLNAATEQWWWGVSFMLTGRKSYGHGDTLDEAMTEYERRKGNP